MRFRTTRSIVFVAFFVLLGGTSCMGESPLAQGLTPDLEAQLVGHTIEQIQSSETFDPSSFEASQRAHFESMTQAMQKTAIEHLPQRVAEINDLGMSQSVILASESVEVTWDQLGPDKIAAKVTIVGDRTYSTQDASRTIATRYSLPWIITIERGKPAFRHLGIRTVNL